MLSIVSMSVLLLFIFHDSLQLLVWRWSVFCIFVFFEKVVFFYFSWDKETNFWNDTGRVKVKKLLEESGGVNCPSSPLLTPPLLAWKWRENPLIYYRIFLQTLFFKSISALCCLDLRCPPYNAYRLILYGYVSDLSTVKKKPVNFQRIF